MDNNAIGGILGLLIFLVLPIVIGLILVFKARALVRSRLRFLAQNKGEHLEPGDAAVTIYRVIGIFFIVAPILILLVGILMTMN